ncbi:hypothetical protein ACTFIZ_004668 [Dictyostelium cf. discoideum]
MKILQSFLLVLPILFSICLFVASLITNIDLKTKIQIKSVFFKFTKIISIGFYIFHIISCFYWVFSIGGVNIGNSSIINFNNNNNNYNYNNELIKYNEIQNKITSNEYNFNNENDEFLKMTTTSSSSSPSPSSLSSSSNLQLKMDLSSSTTSSTKLLINGINDNASYRYYFKLLIQSVKFYQFNDTIIILIPLIFAAISIIFVYLKNSLVNRILFIKIQGFRNETPAGYDVLIRVLYIFMFVFILIIGHFGNLVCLKVNAFEKIGICSYHQNNNNNSFWYYQGFINTLYLVYGYPLYELVNLI